MALRLSAPNGLSPRSPTGAARPRVMSEDTGGACGQLLGSPHQTGFFLGLPQGRRSLWAQLRAHHGHPAVFLYLGPARPAGGRQAAAGLPLGGTGRLRSLCFWEGGPWHRGPWGGSPGTPAWVLLGCAGGEVVLGSWGLSDEPCPTAESLAVFQVVSSPSSKAFWRAGLWCGVAQPLPGCMELSPIRS